MTNEFRPVRSTADRLPDNEIEALMQAKPFEEPQTNSEDLLVLREAVANIVDELGERDLWIINACMSEGKSLQKIADELGMTKTHVWRLRNQAFEKLKGVMMTNSTIRRHVRMADTWEQSAIQWVLHLNTVAHGPVSALTIDGMRTRIDSLAEAYRSGDEIDGTQTSFEEIAATAINDMRYREIWDSGHMMSTLCRKQHDYGHGNINRFGMFGVVVRLNDKIERLANLTNIDQPKNESIEDTLMDIVGYCVIALMLMDNTFNLELGDDYGKSTGHE